MKNILLIFLVLATLASCKKDFEESSLGLMKENTITSSKKRCKADSKMEKIYQNSPGYKQQISKGRKFVNGEIDNPSVRAAEEVLTIPVHVIIVHRSGQSIGQNANISSSRVIKQIDRLNLDFRRANSDASTTPNVFPTSDSKIKFCLAKVDPQGNASSGITRHAFNGNFDNNESEIKSATGWNHRKYLNIWVAETIDGLGYAYLPSPSELPDTNLDGVVILTSTFGDGPALEAPFDKGRTGTHEVGHYLGLDHIWGEGCGVDDGVDDTPPQDADNSGCPNHPSPSCGNQGDMFMNYMDYSDDECMFAFTPGQSGNMRHILNTSRKALVTHGAAICGSGGGVDPTEPTCSDGIKNGNETDIDCGGDCQPCQINQATDLAITKLESSSDGCSNSVSPIVRVKNNGSVSVSNFTINYNVDGQNAKSYKYHGTLAAGKSKRITLEGITVVNGMHTLVAIVTIQGDSNSSNDSKSLALSVSGKNLKIVIQPDDYAGEIEWELWNDNTNELIAEGFNYDDYDLDKIRINLCVEDGCYSFVIYDLYGDGICCDYGNGWFRINDGNNKVIVKSNGNYGYYDVKSFCVNNGQAAAARVIHKPNSDRINTIKKQVLLKGSKNSIKSK